MDVEAADEDVKHLLKLARRLEQDGRKVAAELTYSAASEIARIRLAQLAVREALALFLSPYDGFEGVELAKRCDRATEDRVIIGRRALAKADGQADASPPGSEETK